MKHILLLLFISYFVISCSSNTKTPFEEEAYKMLWPVNIGTLNVNPLLTQTPGYGKK